MLTCTNERHFNCVTSLGGVQSLQLHWTEPSLLAFGRGRDVLEPLLKLLVHRYMLQILKMASISM